MNLILISIAPIFIIAVYIYFRDKYEKEPLGLLFLSLLAGSFITLPAIIVENLLGRLNINTNIYFSAFYDAFVVASFTEESLKFSVLMLLIWRNKNFNERFDGLVYAVFISLGFAMVENLIYVLSNDLSTGILRAVTSVPLHTFTGIFMGFYIGFARFQPNKRLVYMIYSFLLPFFIHGLYDFFLMTQKTLLLMVWLPFIVFLWIKSFQKMKNLSDLSKNDLII